jgi:hypothetical protein
MPMTESMEQQETDDGGDPVLAALNGLSEFVVAGAQELLALDQNLAEMRRQRDGGWTWRHIMEATDVTGALALMAKVAADLGRAGGRFRRALALGLRLEGMQVSEIAHLLQVSRQRVSALINSRRSDFD